NIAETIASSMPGVMEWPSGTSINISLLPLVGYPQLLNIYRRILSPGQSTRIRPDRARHDVIDK
ncbi:MAG: hypothetical protein ABI876_01420, partial [Bacteroidota bacterium]